MFEIGDKITHPMHGAGVIENVTNCEVNNLLKPFYLAKMVFGGMTVLIPCDICESIGVRKIIDMKEAEKIISEFESIPYDFVDNWSRRYRENMEKIKSGDLRLVSQVVKTLYLRDKEKTLSTGERKLYNTAKNILFSELMLSTGKKLEEIETVLLKNK